MRFDLCLSVFLLAVAGPVVAQTSNVRQLTPAERIAFVLHDVFSYSFDAISEILGRSPAACRQLASRARRTINPTDGGVLTVERADAQRVTEQFITACSTGDFDGMLALMDPDCSSHVDIGGLSARARTERSRRVDSREGADRPTSPGRDSDQTRNGSGGTRYL